jgi:amino acid adenylation domain-containing protein
MPNAKSVPIESALQLPFDFYRIPAGKARLSSYEFRLAPSTPDALLAAFGVLLFRYNGQSSILLDAARMTGAGSVLWSQPLELPTGSGTTCREVLEQAAEFLGRAGTTASGLKTFDRHPEGGRAAVVFLEPDVAREFHEAPDAMKIVANSALESRDDDLQLVVANSGGSVHATFLYDSALFRKASVERFAGHLGELSAHLAVDLDAAISKLPLLPPSERRWIESVCDGPPRRSRTEFVHRSFEAQAAAAPEATALRFRDQSLTYRQLNSRANALARYLAANGVGAESRVVVCLEPSFDVVIALLAILKAGAVYVPLDPGYPIARLRASLEDIQPRLVVTRSGRDEKVAAAGAPSLALDDVETLTNGLSVENLELEIGPDQTAYIYYTSGTTGKPKGAAASYANLASYICAARERYRIGKADVMPAIARFSFSISMFELMSPLAAGGTLVLLERDHILDLERMSGTLAETTFFHAGPSLLKNLIAHIKRRRADFGAFSGVRHASSGGDMVAPEVLEGLKQIFFNAEVFVIYGCSEISCMGCTYAVPRDQPVERTRVGRPFDNMSVRVLDPDFNLLPAGVVGEIHFAGDGVVKGYLNRPDLTADKFLELDGRRYYRTGDMGRLGEDGELEIVGRSDFQVKLRGMRVELGEVEYHLRRAAGVRDGVVAAHRLTGDEKSLVAYVVMDREGGEPARNDSLIAAVRRHMMKHLPDYMVPAAYVELDRLPLNHNMKVDRRALPEPETSDRRIAADARFREPRTPTETRLASLWRKLLRLDRIGIDDHFFDLGGHSMLGIALILAVERELGVVFSGMEVLRESLEGQAAICDQRLGTALTASAASAKSAISPAAPDNDFESFYFGEGRSLYGVLSGANRPLASEAVLICSSVGQEHVRTHFTLQRLAKRLAAKGVPALRFDYYGCGDSMGESIAATCGRWRRDIGEAYQELKRRTGATRITAVAVRLGAALLGDAADDLELAKLVLWDPVFDGSKYCAEMAETHEKYVRSLMRWRFLSPLAPVKGGTELIGLVCSETTVRELKALVFAPSRARRRLPLKWLATSQAGVQAELFRSIARDHAGSRMETMDSDPGWNDIARLDQILPDVGISTMLATMAAEQS